jgi:tRNA(fMet)-specific endonuclease VapC
MIDTNIVIHARDGTETILDKLAEYDGSVVLSALCLSELQRGLYKNPAYVVERRARLDVLTRNIPVLPFDEVAAKTYGQIVGLLGWVKGRDFDRLIAAPAPSSGSILVTDNEADFRDIPGLSIENWVRRP